VKAANSNEGEQMSRIIEKVIKALMGDMNVKLFWPLFTFLFINLFYLYDVVKIGLIETVIVAMIESVVMGLIYSMFATPTEAEREKARRQLASIKKFFGCI